jgi:hypothetical protein
MSTFTSTLNYVAGQYIKAIVQATNEIGSTPFSPENTGPIFAQTAPTVSLTITFTTTATSVSLSWNALTTQADLGYSGLIQY